MPSLFSSYDPRWTLFILTLVTANIILVIWSYQGVQQYVQLLIGIPTESGAFDFKLTEFALSIWDEASYLYNSGAWPPAVAVFVTSFLWPFLKTIIYLVLWFTPNLCTLYQRRILRVINQLQRLMFFIFFATVTTDASFSFTMVIPILSPDLGTFTNPHPSSLTLPYLSFCELFECPFTVSRRYLHRRSVP